MGKRYDTENSVYVSVTGLDLHPLEIVHKTKARTWVKIAVSEPHQACGGEDVGLGIRLVTDGTSETHDGMGLECIMSVPDDICEFLTDEEATIARAEYWKGLQSSIGDVGPEDLGTTRKLNEQGTVISLRPFVKR